MAVFTLSEYVYEVAQELVDKSTICSECPLYRHYEDTGAECIADFNVADTNCPLCSGLEKIADKAEELEKEIEDFIKHKERTARD